MRQIEHPITLGSYCEHVELVQCDVFYIDRTQPDDSPGRHINSTRLIRPETVLRPIILRCSLRDCTAAPSEHALATGNGVDLLPELTSMLDSREVQREGVVTCQHGAGENAIPDCKTTLSYRILCTYREED